MIEMNDDAGRWEESRRSRRRNTVMMMMMLRSSSSGRGSRSDSSVWGTWFGVVVENRGRQAVSRVFCSGIIIHSVASIRHVRTWGSKEILIPRLSQFSADRLPVNRQDPRVQFINCKRR